MTLNIELAPEVEARLAVQAQAQGVDLPTYASVVLEQAASRQISSRSASLSEFEAALDRLAARSDNIPLLPDEAFTRESLYRDHD